MRIQASVLKKFYSSLLKAVGTSVEEADIIADVLIDADLHGLETHGALRVPAYIRLAKEGALDASSKSTLAWNKGAVSLIDGSNSWGQPAALMAVKEVIKNAKTSFVGVAGVRNSNHIGVCSYYARILAHSGFVSFITTNSPPAIPPWGGSEAVLGTNPICFGAPTSDGKAVITDMATSVVSKGKILLAIERGESIPKGWALDENGKPTTSPKEALKGTILPVGGPKGYGLSLFVDIFSGVLTGAGVGQQLNSMYDDMLNPSGVGTFIFAINTEVFGRNQVNIKMDELISMVLDSKLAEGFQEISLPGQNSSKIKDERKEKGIPINQLTFNKLNKVAQDLGVKILSQNKERE